MDPLLQALNDLVSEPIGTLLHIGADAATLEALDGVQAQQVVLVQGDPDHAAELRRAATGASARFRVLARVVTPPGGPTRWHRYNLSALNGPVDAGGLVRFYPRLRPAGVLSLSADAFAAVVDAHVATTDRTTRNVLVLDVPGQESALLASLSEAQLRHFDTVLVRGCSEACGDTGTAADQAVQDLATRCYRAAPLALEQDTLWPVHLLRFDAALHRNQLRDQRLAELEAHTETLQRQLEQLQAERADATGLLQERSRQLAQLQQKADEQAASITTLQRERQEQRALVQARTERVAELEQMLAQQTARLDAERAAASSAGASADQRHQELTAALEGCRADLARLGTERDAQAKLATDRASRIEELQKAMEERGAIVARRDRAVQDLQRELAERDARLAECDTRLAALAQAEQQRQQLEPQARRAAQLDTDLQAATAARTKLDAQVKDLSVTLERYRADVARLTTDRDTQAKLVTEKTTQSNDRNKRILQLESELADAQRRLDLMHQELAKAAGQLELLQELLLQEPSL